MKSLIRAVLLVAALSVSLVTIAGCRTRQSPTIRSVRTTAVASFDAPWAMASLPGGRFLVTEHTIAETKPGRLFVTTKGGLNPKPVAGLPPNIGVLDILPHPDYSKNHLVYICFLESSGPDAPRAGRAADDTSLVSAGIAVATGTLVIEATGGGRIRNTKVIWRQMPKVVSFPGSGEPGGKLTLSPDARYLFIAGGDRQEFEPVQRLDNTLGKVVRLFADGRVPSDNPFVKLPGAMPEIWTLGHRNPYGLAFDPAGRLWEHENGPAGGDELNLIRPGSNYGWPNLSYGSAYTGEKYLDPKRGDGYARSAGFWTPAIAPSGMIFYSGRRFAAWNGDAIVGSLAAQAVVRLHPTSGGMVDAQRLVIGARIRDVEQDSDGAIWVLEDAPQGHLVKLDPLF